MPTFLQTENLIGTGLQLSIDAAGDNHLILDGVVVASVDDEAVSGVLGDNKLRVDGTVVAETTAIFLSGGENEVTIGHDGTVVSNVVGTSGAAIALGTNSADGGSLLTNFGQISAPGRIAVLTPRSDVVNHGTIDGVSPVFLGVFGRAGATLTNTGIISAVGEGDDIGTRYKNAVFFEGDNGLVINSESGIITASFAGGAAIRFGSEDGVGGGGGRVNNAGEILSLAGVGITAAGVPDVQGISIVNSGTISGGTSAIVGSRFADTVTNIGEIFGNVRLAQGNDAYRASGDGEATGIVRGGLGADTLVGGRADDRFIGEAGEDSLFGGAGDDLLQGLVGRDTLRGGAGDDTLEGGGLADLLRGGTGEDLLAGGTFSDTLQGGFGEDTLLGGAGADTLFGGPDDDQLFGGSEADLLNGGRGDDLLQGGLGSDRFVFFEGSGRDRITDFQNGVDRIDLQEFGLTNFADLTSTFSLTAIEGGVRLVADDDVLVIEGVALAALNGADFIF